MSQAYALGGAASSETFSVGRALSRSFSIFGQGAVSFIALTAAAYVPLLIVTVLAAIVPEWATVIGAVSPFIQMIVGAIASAACLFGSYQVMRGASFSISESLTAGLGRFWPVLGASILAGLITVFASLLLIVPGLMVACALYVALPACVIERIGPSASLKRSRALTLGHRWGVFGLFILITIASLLVAFGFAFAADWLAGSLAGALATLVGEVIVGAFQAVLYAVVYHDLRVEKEGVDVSRLAKVFE